MRTNPAGSGFRRGWRAALGIVAILAPGVLVADGAPEVEIEPAEQLVSSLAEGSDPYALVERVLLEGSPPASPLPPRSKVEAQLSGDYRRLVEEWRATASTPEGAKSDEIARWKATLDRFEARDLLFRHRLSDLRATLVRAEVGHEIVARLDEAERRYVEIAEPWLRFAESPGTVRPPEPTEARPALRVLRNQLPFGGLDLPPRPLPNGAPIVPSYLDLSDPEPTADDLAPGPLTPFSEAIVAQAEALGFEPVAIYEFVRNEIATEWYSGAMKGAEGTLRHRAGNDVDQATLLVALLRASSQPARFVSGVVRRPVGKLETEFGVAGPAAVIEALTRAGIAHRPVVEGGSISALDLEHTWVSARIPYGNYRGAVVDHSSPTWVPLAPSVKPVDRIDPARILREAGVEVDSLISESMLEVSPTTPLEGLRSRILDYLESVRPTETYQEQLGEVAVTPLVLGSVPSSMPIGVPLVFDESSSLTEPSQQFVAFRLYAEAADSGDPILEFSVPVARVIDRRVTLSYLPESLQDHRTINLFGGLGGTPAYLVRLRPQISIGGRPQAVGLSGVEMAIPHRLEIAFTGPFGSATVDHQVIAGGFVSLVFGGQEHTPIPASDDDPQDFEPRASSILSQLGLAYGAAWDTSEAELAGLLDVELVRPVPSVVVVSNEVEVQWIEDLPLSLQWQGVSLDAAFRATEALAPADDLTASREWNRLAALEGSALEHQLFSDRFLVEAVSADRGLAQARQDGRTVHRIDASNLAALLPQLAHPAEVLEAVEEWALAGFTVEVPETTIQYLAWRGSVWRVEDEATGHAGYFIAGGLAGGQTAEHPENWVVGPLVDDLRDPYGGSGNTDPMSAVRLVKFDETDGQFGVVNAYLDDELTVVALDALGRPVAGASVTFELWGSEGQLVNAGPDNRVTLTTDNSGMARARLQLGRNTSANPVFYRLKSADLHPTQVLEHEILISVDSDGGTIHGDPFTAYGVPDDVVELVRPDGRGPLIEGQHPGVWVDTILVKALDRFDNPVSNTKINFLAGEAGPSSNCPESYPPSFPRLGAALFDSRDAVGSGCNPVFPIRSECSEPTFESLTSPFGVAAGVLIGDSMAIRYSVTVAAPEVPGEIEELVFYYQTLDRDPDPILSPGCQTYQLLVESGPHYIDELGNPVGATEAGSFASFPLQAILLARYEGSIHDSEVHYRRALVDRMILRRFEGYVSPSPTDPRWVGPEVPMALGPDFVYRGPADTASLPMLNRTRAATPGSVTAWVNPANQTVEPIGWWEACPSWWPPSWYCIQEELPSIWGLDVRVRGFTPQLVEGDEVAGFANAFEVRYSVEPDAYTPTAAELRLQFEGELVNTAPATKSGGSYRANIRQGLYGDKVRALVNPGSLIEVRSGLVEVPVSGKLFGHVSRSVTLHQEVDLPNGTVCSQPDIFEFELLESAEVTLTFRRIESETPDGEPVFGDETVFYGHTLPADHHQLELLAGDLLPGRYEFTLEATTLAGIHREREGKAFVGYRSRDVLPVGHVLIEGVDLFDGHLAVSRNDLSVPGRGISLDLSRTYSSGSSTPGSLGVGWSHSYTSRIEAGACGELVLVGSEGSGTRFFPDGEGGYTPGKGYHGTLVRSTGTDRFDFYSKNGNRYHFGPVAAGYHRLEWMADPNGNTTRLIYDGQSEEGEKLIAVEDSSGRRLRFFYEQRAFAFWDGMVIQRVEGPNGLSIRYEYDDYGNLVAAAREPHADGTASRVESYHYATEPTLPVDERHLLLEVHDEVGQGATLYSYDRGVVGIQGDVQVPVYHVERVERPEGGVFTFALDHLALASGASTLTTTVTDPRLKDTVYTLNRYGSPVEIEDALGGTTVMVWSLDDILMLSRTDANQATTTFEYDDHGNVVRESVSVTDADGVSRVVTVETAHVPPENFPVPIKNRVESRTDRNQHTTTFSYDLQGNLLQSWIEVVDATAASSLVEVSHTYKTNGDRISTTNPRGFVSTFGYDDHGYLTSVTDDRGHITSSGWDPRGRRLQRTDAEGRVTTYEYDTLDRLVATYHPAVTSGSPVDRVLYDDSARTVAAIDAELRTTLTSLDREGRPIRIENAEGGVKEFQYDDAGNKILESSWFDDETPRFDVSFSYDDLSRLTTRTEPLGRVTRYGYDPVGNVIREALEDDLDPQFEPRITEFDYDELNRRIRTRRYLDGFAVEHDMVLDPEGNAIVLRDPLERETHQRFDALNRRIETVGPEWTEGRRRTERHFYDENGNLTRQVLENEPADQVWRYQYDYLDRLEQEQSPTGGLTSYSYDRVGNLTSKIDPRLYQEEYEYDDRNQRTRVSQRLDGPSALGWVATDYRYDLVGNLIAEELPNGNTVEHRYDGLDRRFESFDSIGPLARSNYDARGNTIETFDAKGHLTVNTFDWLDRLVQQDLPADREVRFIYDASRNRTATTDARGNTTTYRYDTLDRLLEVRDPVPFSTQTEVYEYDLVGNLRFVTDRRGNRREQRFDALDRLVATIDPPLGGDGGPQYQTTAEYDAAGNRVGEADRRGISSEFTYDPSNQLLTATRAGLRLETRTYDAGGKLIFLDDAKQIRTGYQYDERGLLISENLPLAGITGFKRDAMGDVVEETDPRNRTTVFSRDLRRRVRIETNFGLEQTLYEYDLNGNQTAKVRPKALGDPAEYRWEYDYDAADRLAAVRDPLDHETTYGYDGNSNRTRQTDGENRSTLFGYDELNRLDQMTYPDGSTIERYTYDPNDNLVGRQDPMGQEFTTEYDEVNRPAAETYPIVLGVDGLRRVEKDYDPNGNLIEVREIYSGPTGLRTTTQQWDAFDRLTSRSDPFGKVLQYGYDLNGNRSWLIDPDDRTTLYSYDDANRLTGVTVPESQATAATITTYAYHNDGRVREVLSPGGLETHYTYDAVGRVATIANRDSAGSISFFSYDYDPNGNRTFQAETNGGEEEQTTYTYDAADRLVSIEYPDKTTAYTYDAVGNRLTEVDHPTGSPTPSKSRTYSYDDRHRLLGIADAIDPSASVAYGYDLNGNQTSKTSGGQTTHFTFDGRDRIASIQRELPQGGTELLGKYLYDYQGLRVEKRNASGLLRYTYDEQSVLTQFGLDGLTIARYEYGPDRLLSLDRTGEGRQFYLFDALGSPVNLVSPDGTVQQRTQYDAWGNVRAEVGESWNPFGFTGHELDDETGLYYARARFYDPEVGRFLSEDPFGGETMKPPSLHKYLYAYQNPTVWVDPTGRYNEEQRKLDAEKARRKQEAKDLEEMRGVLGRLQERAAEGGPNLERDLLYYMHHYENVPARIAPFYVAAVLGRPGDALLSELEGLGASAEFLERHIGDMLLGPIMAADAVLLTQSIRAAGGISAWLAKFTEAAAARGPQGKLLLESERKVAGVAGRNLGGVAGSEVAVEAEISVSAVDSKARSQGIANNTKGTVFENVRESALRRRGATPFFRATRRGGIDVGVLEDGTVVIEEAKFANKLQFDDFTAITENLEGNVREVIASLRGNTMLTQAQKAAVRETLERFLAGEVPGNLQVRVVTGKSSVGPRLQTRLRENTGGLPVEFEEMKPRREQ